MKDTLKYLRSQAARYFWKERQHKYTVKQYASLCRDMFIAYKDSGELLQAQISLDETLEEFKQGKTK